LTVSIETLRMKPDI